LELLELLLGRLWLVLRRGRRLVLLLWRVRRRLALLEVVHGLEPVAVAPSAAVNVTLRLLELLRRLVLVRRGRILLVCLLLRGVRRRLELLILVLLRRRVSLRRRRVPLRRRGVPLWRAKRGLGRVTLWRRGEARVVLPLLEPEASASAASSASSSTSSASSASSPAAPAPTAEGTAAFHAAAAGGRFDTNVPNHRGPMTGWHIRSPKYEIMLKWVLKALEKGYLESLHIVHARTPNYSS
jgi:hypothetical protein